MGRVTRKERDDLRKRQEILKTACEIFAARGFHGTTMVQISKASQYPLGTIYKYFPGKKEMYHDLVIERIHELGHILVDIKQNKDMDAPSKLFACMKAQSEFYRANQEVVKIYISERSNIDAVAIPKLNERVNRLNEKMVSLFQDILEQGIEAGEIRDYPAPDMAELFSHIAHSAAWASLFREEDESQINQRLLMIFEMLTKGIANSYKKN